MRGGIAAGDATSSTASPAPVSEPGPVGPVRVRGPEPKSIYTFGYQGQDVAALKARINELDAVLADIRLVQRSRIPGWSGHELRAALGWNYLSVPWLGNLGYKGNGPMRLRSPAGGIPIVLEAAHWSPVVLMCACRNYHTCHRKLVSEILAEFGVVTEELTLPPSRPVCTVALSIKQPWAWLIANGYKDIENRDWATQQRGEVLIHAGKSFDQDGYDWVRYGFPDIPMPHRDSFECGGIVGSVEITDCVRESDSEWFLGDWGFVLSNGKPLPFRPMRGKLGFFVVSEDQIKEAT